LDHIGSDHPRWSIAPSSLALLTLDPIAAAQQPLAAAAARKIIGRLTTSQRLETNAGRPMRCQLKAEELIDIVKTTYTTPRLSVNIATAFSYRALQGRHVSGNISSLDSV